MTTKNGKKIYLQEDIMIDVAMVWIKISTIPLSQLYLLSNEILGINYLSQNLYSSKNIIPILQLLLLQENHKPIP